MYKWLLYLNDLHLYIERFGLEFTNKNDIPFKGFSSEAIGEMKKYNWPGNIRELENIIQRAVIMCDKAVGVKDLPDHLKYNLEMPENKLVSLAEMERDYIKKVLRSTGNNKTKAAEILQITRKTLRHKLDN